MASEVKNHAAHKMASLLTLDTSEFLLSKANWMSGVCGPQTGGVLVDEVSAGLD
jgi:hypothetical protein